ncbi:hypothetical protein KI387_001694, partial [Taxus chinensis]
PRNELDIQAKKQCIQVIRDINGHIDHVRWVDETAPPTKTRNDEKTEEKEENNPIQLL